MKSPAYEEGRRAAAEEIPADANPHQDGTAEHAQWAEGHESIASAIEASQSEGT